MIYSLFGVCLLAASLVSGQYTMPNCTALGNTPQDTDIKSYCLEEMINMLRILVHGPPPAIPANLIQTSPAGTVRLVSESVGDQGMGLGRLEVLHDGQWGTVCADAFDDVDAGVVCKEVLGANFDGDAEPGGFQGEGADPIWKDEAACTGTEASFLDCASSGWGVHDCTHSDDAAVFCFNFTVSPDIIATSPAGTVRIVSKSTQHFGWGIGRVEVFHNGKWGSVCDDAFGDVDAGVVCREVHGSTFDGDSEGGGYGGQGKNGIVMDEVACTGTETSLFDCGNEGLGVSNCDHTQDVAVFCFDTA